MRRIARRLLDRAFTAAGAFAILLLAGFLLLFLVPIFQRGMGALIFQGTVEHRRAELELFSRGDAARMRVDLAAVTAAREPVWRALAAFDAEWESLPAARRRELKPALAETRKALTDLFGPPLGARLPELDHNRYGQTRWDRAQVKLERLLFGEDWIFTNGVSRRVLTPREQIFAGTALAPLFPEVKAHLREMMLPRLTFYTGFVTSRSRDAHFFGGIGPEILGTLYLTLGAMLLAIPFGIIAAIYFQEYAREGALLSLLRSCVSTLAGVPSIVFGLFGLAFFINTLHVSRGKSVLAGALTLALLILPTIIRASEEAIRAVPRTYKEAAMALGAGRWRTIATVILPAALPGILTGVVISMGRAAGETAPIIFTAAVSAGAVPALTRIFADPTPALPWNIYNLCTEHAAVDEIRHVQYGMVMMLVLLVLALNLTAILLRARVTRRLKG